MTSCRSSPDKTAASADAADGWLAHRILRAWPRRRTVRQPFSTEDRTYGSAFA
jgi:hypothetical protein